MTLIIRCTTCKGAGWTQGVFKQSRCPKCLGSGHLLKPDKGEPAPWGQPKPLPKPPK